ncbi:MAG: PfkB family carbohydrate kinase [Victivallaceae bacterium]|nr:PfkB family carbohydrate kinase [Victivallaceae bacterium]
MNSGITGTYKYRAMVSTGGIGTGSFFALNGNHTLGREESRSGHFLKHRDYCKQHIIGHYVRTLLGAEFQVYPIGQVGDDKAGHELIEEMRQAGLKTDFLKITDKKPTLCCICFIYPDGSGGNLTVDESACSLVSGADVAAALPVLEKNGGKCIALAVPEVPLNSRQALLEAAARCNALRIASFLSEEMPEVRKNNLLSLVNLLAINIDEASSLAEISSRNPPDKIVAESVRKISAVHPRLQLSITAGKTGSWIWDRGKMYFQAPVPVHAVGTAGAGDAYLSGLIVGLTAGLELRDAQVLAVLTAALSVTVPDSIHKGIDRTALSEFALKQPQLPPALGRLLKLKPENNEGCLS